MRNVWMCCGHGVGDEKFEARARCYHVEDEAESMDRGNKVGNVANGDRCSCSEDVLGVHRHTGYCW